MTGAGGVGGGTGDRTWCDAGLTFVLNELRVAWRGVAWRGVVGRGGAWRGVAWWGVVGRGGAWISSVA